MGGRPESYFPIIDPLYQKTGDQNYLRGMCMDKAHGELQRYISPLYQKLLGPFCEETGLLGEGKAERFNCVSVSHLPF